MSKELVEALRASASASRDVAECGQSDRGTAEWFEGSAHAYGEAAYAVEKADLLSRPELVEWLRGMALVIEADGASEDVVRSALAKAQAAALRVAARTIEEGSNK
jgi:hypothetical protein